MFQKSADFGKILWNALEHPTHLIMKEEIKEEIQSLKTGFSNTADIFMGPVKQRMSNPFIGSFAITFICLNWRPIIFLIISDKTIEDKFGYITDNFYNDGWYGTINWFMYLVFPFLISLSYMVLLPKLTNWIETEILHTVKNKSEREFDLRKQRLLQLEQEALAAKKIEDARTGFEKSEKINQDLVDLREALKKEKEQSETYLREKGEIAEQINQLKNSLKEAQIKEETTANDYRITKTELDKRQKTIEELNIRLEDRDRNISELNNKITLLESSIKNLESEKQMIFDEKSVLDSQAMQLNMELEDLRVKLSQYDEFERSIVLLREYYQRIASVLPRIPNPDFFTYEDTAEFLRKSNSFVANLSEYLQNHRIDEENLLLHLYRVNDLPEKTLLNHIFSSARDLNIRIYNISFQENNLITISMHILDGNILQNFIQNGKGYWDIEKWQQFSK